MNSHSTHLQHLKTLLLFPIMFLVIASTQVLAQDRVIKGKVISIEDGMSLPGANVRIKKSNKGTITDMNGEYSISVSAGDVLVYSFIGMKTKEITVSSQSVIDVSLDSDVGLLDEVVKIGYGDQRRKEVSGAVAHVKAETIKQFVTSDIGSALQGQIAGVSVTSASGAPGAPAVIQIRGIGTVVSGSDENTATGGSVTGTEGANEPLYVVDGIPQSENPRLSPNEIESMDVLKDLASCAIYGTRGANGVILITTKNGSKGKLNVTLDASYGVKNIISYTPVMNFKEQVYSELVTRRNTANAVDDQVELVIQRTRDYFNNNSDIGPHIFNDNAATQNYNLNISGGSGNGLTYNLTGGLYKDVGNIIQSEFDRYNIRGGSSYKSGKLKVTSSISASVEERKRPSFNLLNQTVRYKPYMPDFTQVMDGGNVYGGYDNNELTRITHILASLNFDDIEKRERVAANVSLTYELAKGLKFTTNLGGNIVSTNRSRFAPYFEVVNLTTGTVTSNATVSSYYEERVAKRTSLSWDGRLFYQKKINGHNFSALLGSSVEEYTNSNFNALQRGISDNSIRGFGSATSEIQITPGFNYVYKIIGTIGRLQYDYKGKYMFSVSGNYNANSKFSANNKWKFFPSVSAAWNVADESFWDDFRGVANSFKIRASRGTVGGQSFAAYADAATIVNRIDYAFGPDELVYTGAVQQAYANRNIQWETAIQNNVGVDLAFFDNRLTFNADAYYTTKQDMLFPVQLPASAGTSVGAGSLPNSMVTLNVGNMVNKGYELALGVRGHKKNWKWSVNGTFSQNLNEITKMNTSGDFIYTNDQGMVHGTVAKTRVTVLSEGYEAGAFFLYKTDGLINTEEKLAEYKQIKPTARMGDIRLVDVNGDGTISEADKTYRGSGLPDFETGLTINLSYKNFDFMMQWYAAVGHEVMNGSRLMAFSQGRHKMQYYMWSEANPTSTVPVYRGNINEDSSDNSRGDTDYWMEDGSYIRLKNISLGYNLPKNIVKRIGLGGLRFFIGAQNPVIFTKYTGYDPEVGGDGVATRGLDKGIYPISALYNGGFKMTF